MSNPFHGHLRATPFASNEVRGGMRTQRQGIRWHHGPVRFLLIHGTSQSPAGWLLFANALADFGHAVEVVDLAQFGSDLSSAGYAAAVAAAVESKAGVVVAHSGSGLLLPAIASATDAVAQVYLAAGIPDGSRSLMNELDDEATTMVHDDWIGVDPTTDREIARHFLFHDCAAAISDWAIGTLRSFVPAAIYSEVIPLAPKIPAVAIVPDRDRTLRTEWMIAAARERLGVEPIVVPGGHCPHVSRPADLAKVLTSALSEG